MCQLSTIFLSHRGLPNSIQELLRKTKKDKKKYTSFDISLEFLARANVEVVFLYLVFVYCFRSKYIY